MTAKGNCEKLLDELLPIGVHFMKKSGEFYPYGAVMKLDETIELLAFYEGHEFPDSKTVLDGLKSTCKQLAERNEILASGLVWNSSVSSDDGKETDAIIFSLEHRDDYSINVALPYKIGLFKSVKFKELMALKGNSDVF